MATILKCHICGEKIYPNSYLTSTLGEHLLAKHPNADITFYESESNENCKCSGSKKVGQEKKSCAVFKTTVETWKDGPLKIRCPQCLQEDNPCVRKQRNRIAYSKLGAFCMLICWPLCFMPFLMPAEGAMEIYCKHCGNYFGIYNRKTGQIICRCDTDGKTFDRPCK